MMAHFSAHEFDCKCGCALGLNDIKPRALGKLLAARDMSNVQFVINSAMRCKKHNDDVNGSPTSSHMSGYAFDIRTTNSYERFVILRSLIFAGFRRIGIYSDFIHCDDDPSKGSCVTWIEE